MGSQVSAWENHGETESMEHSGKKAGWEELGAESGSRPWRAGSCETRAVVATGLDRGQQP